jgi:hypothetical protein
MNTGFRPLRQDRCSWMPACAGITKQRFDAVDFAIGTLGDQTFSISSIRAPFFFGVRVPAGRWRL